VCVWKVLCVWLCCESVREGRHSPLPSYHLSLPFISIRCQAFVDPDGDALTFSLKAGSLPTGTGFSLVNGVFSGSPTDRDAAQRTLTPVIVASDGREQAEAPLSLIISAEGDSSLLAIAIPTLAAVQNQPLNAVPTAGYFRHPVGNQVSVWSWWLGLCS
jgi:hypothetical protein